MKDIHRKIIIIQGPLKTYGQGPNNSLEGFDSSKYILQNINRITEAGFDYLLVTWEFDWINETEAVNFLKNEVKSRLIIDYPESVFDPDHRYKHHYALSKAFEHINLDIYTHVGKIRTDQLMPQEYFEYIRDIDDDKLIVSELMKGNSFYLGDFIYFGKIQVFKDFIYSQLVPRILHPIIANNIGLRYYLKKNQINRLFLLFVYLTNQSKIDKMWADFVETEISLLPSEICKQIKWRERYLSDIIDFSKFLFFSSNGLKYPILSYTQTNVKYLYYGYIKYLKRIIKVILTKS